jgi:ABC-type oligopeptide transport system ATPase subunit
MPILETHNLSKVYPDTEPVVASNKVNLTVEKG